MKKTVIKILAISLAAIMMCFVFASCSNAPKGTYSNDTVTLEFEGETVTLTYGDTKKTTVEGEFEMDEDDEGNPIIDIDLPEAESLFDMEYSLIRAALQGEKSYNQGSDNNGDYIEIGGAKYYKE